MGEIKICRSLALTVLQACLVVPVFYLLNACGSGTSNSALTASVVNASSPSARALRVDVSPALSPSFDPSIHDYVINCTSSSEVQFTAVLNDNPFGFWGPADRPNKPMFYPLNMFQKSLTMTAGQRFRFIVGAGTPEYSVRCLPRDFPPLSVSVSGTSAAQAEWYLFAPDLVPTVAGYGAYVILTDAHGTPVWWMNSPGIDAKIFGNDQIAWSFPTVYGVGGQYVFRSFDGNIVNTLSGNLDEHDLQETPTGTYLAIRDVTRVCPPDCADMSQWGGSAQAAVVDAEIIEIDKDSNVLWTWRTRDHVALSETGQTGWFPGQGNDIIHMNAVEPDGTDGFMFSARHLNAIYHVTKSTGAIDWKIGGTPRPESLVVLGDTRPTSIGATGQSLSGQHDIRKLSDGTITVHDNGSIANRPPFALRYRLDTVARTAEVVESIRDTRVSASGYVGSARRLPGGHWLVQWGGSPFMTELDAAGNSVLTIQYNLGIGFSYRAVPVLSGTLSAAMLRDGMDAMVGR
jgi:hypothetical protein